MHRPFDNVKSVACLNTPNITAKCGLFQHQTKIHKTALCYAEQGVNTIFSQVLLKGQYSSCCST